MIGQIDPRDHEVTVVGAGFSGLLAAYCLDQRGYSVTLLESSERAGGLIHTEYTDWGLAEGAAHALLATPTVVRFFEEIGVPLLEVRPDSKSRFILRDGKLRRFPLKPWEALTAFFRAYF